jgi:alpha-glucosidase
VQPTAHTPLAWWQRGAIYQIYPRSFADSNGDGVGELAGITGRLDHLDDGSERSLGVQAIWLSPFYPSPMADFGYDVADYCDVDPLFGTLDDFDSLLEAARGRGMRVLVDWVPNHTSDRHPWFAESRSGRDSPKRDWYVWRDPAPGGGPPNNWRSDFKAVGSAWSLDERTGQYYLHSFAPQQPDLNWENPAVEAAMHDVLRFWLRRGVDGFRIDVAHKLGKDPKLRDNEPGERPRDRDWPTVHDRLRGIRRVVDEFEDRMIVGEVYLTDLRRVIDYVNSGDELHLAHNFVFLKLPWDARAVRDSVEQFDSLASELAWPAWFFSNHDHPRVATRFSDGDPATGARRARGALLLTTALRGTPFVYQGEELALPDATIPPSAVVDVDGRDPERAPIPWRRPSQVGPGAGFTTGRPWLPIVEDAERLCVEAQDGDPGSTLSFARRLCWLRRREPALQAGAQRALDAAPGVLAFVREHRGERWLAAVNFESTPATLRAREALGSGTVELSTDNRRTTTQLDTAELTLGPDEGVLIRLAT